MIYVYKGFGQITPDMYQRWLDDAPEQRRQKVLRHKSYEQKLLSLTAYRLLCFALGTGSVELELGSNGKPYLKDHKIHFSLTHCKGLAACAVSGSPVGLDAEPVRPYPQNVLSRVFTQREIGRITGADDPNRAFFTFWTLKESYIKALGTGLAFPLREVEFMVSDGQAECSDSSYRFAVFRHDPHIISVCGQEDHRLRLVKPDELLQLPV